MVFAQARSQWEAREGRARTTLLQLFCILLVVESVLANCNCKMKHKHCRSWARCCHPTGGNGINRFFSSVDFRYTRLRYVAVRQRLLFASNHRLRLTTTANSANSTPILHRMDSLLPAICMHIERPVEKRDATFYWLQFRKIQPHALQRKLARWIFILNGCSDGEIYVGRRCRSPIIMQCSHTKTITLQ